MDLQLTNPNYCATIVDIQSFVKLDNLDNLVGAPMHGFMALVTKDYQPGLYVLFGAETELSEEFCKQNNLFEKKEMNGDPTKKGYISHKRRVRAVKLRGHMSTALLMKLDSFNYLGVDITQFKEGGQFNEVNGVSICKKYIIRKQQSSTKNGKPRVKQFKARQLVDSKMIPEHIDTTHWGRNHFKVDDDQLIIVSQKIHGTSVRLANQRIAVYPKWLINPLSYIYSKGFGNYKIVNRIERLFRKMIWSPVAGSRKVIKLKNLNLSGYYQEDVYNQALDKVAHLIPKGWVLYGELIGWAGDKEIQRHYTYCLEKGQFELYLYRIAIVNEDGLSCDLSYDQMVNWAKENGLKVCPEMWRGPKKNFDYNKFMDINYVKAGYSQCVKLSEDSPCDEGVVIRVESYNLTPSLYKAKSPIFLGHESKQADDEVVSLEDIESSTDNEDNEGSNDNY